jgi:hypothetical protein
MGGCADICNLRVMRAKAGNFLPNLYIFALPFFSWGDIEVTRVTRITRKIRRIAGYSTWLFLRARPSPSVPAAIHR